MGLTYCLRVPVTAASMPVALRAAVLGHERRIRMTRRPGTSPVNHRSCAPCRHGRHTAPAPSFARRIGWRETQFAQQCAQGDVHLHVGEPRADTTVDPAAGKLSSDSRATSSPTLFSGAAAMSTSYVNSSGVNSLMGPPAGVHAGTVTAARLRDEVPHDVLKRRRKRVGAAARCDSGSGGHPYFSGTQEFSLSTPQLQGDRWPS
jgi:hypothetical protein